MKREDATKAANRTLQLAEPNLAERVRNRRREENNELSPSREEEKGREREREREREKKKEKKRKRERKHERTEQQHRACCYDRRSVYCPELKTVCIGSITCRNLPSTW